jgi:DNA-binding NarL/FixJ family response regulator
LRRGKTERGISDELVVTRKTVEAHVCSILGKLDLATDANENRRVHAVLAFLRAGGAGRVSNPAVEERGHG